MVDGPPERIRLGTIIAAGQSYRSTSFQSDSKSTLVGPIFGQCCPQRLFLCTASCHSMSIEIIV